MRFITCSIPYLQSQLLAAEMVQEGIGWFNRSYVLYLTPVLILWEVWRNRNIRKYEENYVINGLNQRRAIIARVRYWLIRLTGVTKFTSPSSTEFAKAANKTRLTTTAQVISQGFYIGKEPLFIHFA